MRPISAIFTLPQDALPRVIAARAKGKLAVTALDGDSGATLGVGTLELIDNQIDPATGTLRLKAEFPNDQDTLWPGQFVTIRLRLGDVPDGLTLPTRAIQRGPKGFFRLRDPAGWQGRGSTGRDRPGRQRPDPGHQRVAGRRPDRGRRSGPVCSKAPWRGSLMNKPERGAASKARRHKTPKAR